MVFGIQTYKRVDKMVTAGRVISRKTPTGVVVTPFGRQRFRRIAGREFVAPSAPSAPEPPTVEEKQKIVTIQPAQIEQPQRITPGIEAPTKIELPTPSIKITAEQWTAGAPERERKRWVGQLSAYMQETKEERVRKAKEKKANRGAYGGPGGNDNGQYGRGAFAEFNEIFEIETEFNKLIESITALPVV